MDKIPLVDLKANYISIKNEIDEAIKDVIDKSSFIMSEHVTNFEKEFAKKTKSEFCVSTSNGTSSLFIAMQALGLKQGDEVITVPNTFIATTEAITLLGGKIKFIDVDEETLLMNPDLIEKQITKKTKIIIPVHLYGQMADMERIKEIADRHSLKIIEDAAQSHFATFKGKQPGCFGDIASYSFFPAKNLGCFGDAGGVTTNNKEYSEVMAKLRDHGRTSKYESSMEGFNFRMDSLQAAILSVKLRHIDRWTEQRRKNAKLYNEFLENVVDIPVEGKNRRHVYYAYQVMAKNRDRLKEHLNKNNINTGLYYPIPLHLQKAYSYMSLKPGTFPVTEESVKKILAIPMFPELKEEQISYICNKITECV